MNNPIPESDLRTIKDAILAGRKIEAIKLYRQYSGSGLKDAKDAVEELEKKLMAESPGKFQTESTDTGKEHRSGSPTPGVQVGKGCFGVTVAGIVLAATIFGLIAVMLWC